MAEHMLNDQQQEELQEKPHQIQPYGVNFVLEQKQSLPHVPANIGVPNFRLDSHLCNL